MADLSKIKAPDGTKVDIKDATARSGLADKMDKAGPTGTGSLSMNRRDGTTAGSYSTTLGYIGTASGNYSTSLGNRTKATGTESVAEGYSSTASGSDSHAEGYSTTASGASAHSEGSGTTASGQQSHAEGSSCTAAAAYSHAEGKNTSISADAIGSHVEGIGTQANAQYSHAEGSYTIANSVFSHVEGVSTIASGIYQHVSGKYNIEDSNNAYAEIIGNGSDLNNRSNARTLDWSGNEWLAGELSCGNFSASGSTITLGSPANWRNAIFNTTNDRLAFTLSRPNVYLYEYIGNKGSGDGIVKIALPENNSSMYDIYISETGWKHIGTVRAVAATNANGALDYCGYASISPTLTAAYGTVTATTNRNIQVTGTGNRQLYMSVGSYSVLNVKIITSSPEAPNVYFQ